MQSERHLRGLALPESANGPGARGGKRGLEVWRDGRVDRGLRFYLTLIACATQYLSRHIYEFNTTDARAWRDGSVSG